ncbi:MAG: hypothetical protein WBC29_01850 [Candidatus Moraniibacteriota bacterium]
MNPLDVLIPSPPPPAPEYRWGVVTSVDPRKVLLEGASTALSVASTLTSVHVGQRVFVLLIDRLATIIGAGDGPAASWRMHGQRSLSGGGARSVSSTGIAWTSRLITIGPGRGATGAASGFFDINVPANGTVIPRIGVTPTGSATVASGVIPMAAWDTLWYVLPLGSTFSSQPGNFIITSYTADAMVPAHWVRVVARSGDTACATYTWGDGREQDIERTVTFQNGWGNYGSIYKTATYRYENGNVILSGLVAGGTVSTGATGTIFTLPAGFRPGAARVFGTQCSTGTARCDVLETGEVKAMAGANPWFTISGISFQAVQ